MVLAVAPAAIVAGGSRGLAQGFERTEALLATILVSYYHLIAPVLGPIYTARQSQIGPLRWPSISAILSRICLAEVHKAIVAPVTVCVVDLQDRHSPKIPRRRWFLQFHWLTRPL